MVAKGSPKLTLIARASPKSHRFMAPSGIKKKPSPKGSRAKKTGGSPKAKQRADWNLALERSLVDILHEYKDSGYRGDTGCWSFEGWNKMVKEFQIRNKYVNYTKGQIQDKETQLKRDYRMLKLARQQSGASWNEHRNMVEGSPSMWANLKMSYPKIKKFNNSKATFPFFYALGELYDGHLAEGYYNITSLESPQEEEGLQIHDVEDLENNEEHEVLDEDDDSITEIQVNETATVGEENEITIVEKSRQQGTTTSSKQYEKDKKRPKKCEKEENRPRKGLRIEDMMGRYLDMRTKEVEDEAADLAKEKEAANQAKEKEAAKVKDFSITRCISVLSTIEMTKAEKAKAFQVFIKSKENREAFLSGCEVDKDVTLMWLKSLMD